MELTLREKIDFILKKYNNGNLTEYAEIMLYAIGQFEKGNKEYHLFDSRVIRISYNDVDTYTVEELIGDCILLNNENFFNQ